VRVVVLKGGCAKAVGHALEALCSRACAPRHGATPCPRLSYCPTSASLHIEYPMLFRVEGLSGGRVTHCGVLEFVADEGVVYMPHWVRLLSPLCGAVISIYTSRTHVLPQLIGSLRVGQRTTNTQHAVQRSRCIAAQ
jgi:hypothetical protein